MQKLEVALKNDLVRFSEQLESDELLKEQIHAEVVDICDQYVPYITGELASKRNITITKDGITYEQPYASNVYESTNAHNLEHHPLASSRWDEVALANHRDELDEAVAKLIERRIKELENG